MTCHTQFNDKKGDTRPLPFPPWMKRPMAYSGKQKSVIKQLASAGLHTVCSEAKCPNRCECFSRGVATFLVMGTICTRNCSFCNVEHGKPGHLDMDEIFRVVDASRELKLNHVVITSVTRDDLPDGGAAFFAKLVEQFRRDLPGVTVEVLIPDFQGIASSIDTVICSKPDILNHNVETVPRLYAEIRPQANYTRSLLVLKRAAQQGLVTKSGIMVGLGEKESDVLDVMRDLRDHGCSILTIGQYLRPSPQKTPVVDFINPQQYERYTEKGKEMGFSAVFAGPYVRSSYRAEEVLHGKHAR